MTRVKPKEGADDEVLMRSARRCALCFGLHGSLEQKKGQVAHVDRDASNSIAENLAFLCLPCHDEYDTKPSQSKRLTTRELLNYRNRLYEVIAMGGHLVGAAGHVAASGVTTDSIAHDRDLFRALDAHMSERLLADFLQQLRVDDKLKNADQEAVRTFLAELELESNRFAISELNDTRDAFFGALLELDQFMATHFFRDQGLAWARLYPDHRRSPHDERVQFYNRYASELMRICDTVRDSFKDYRRTVKRLLLL